MALGAPATKWPTFDQDRLQQIVDAFAAEGVTACPDEVRNTPDITGRRLDRWEASWQPRV